MPRASIVWIAAACFALTPLGGKAYVDSDEEDVLIDAPWRTVRNYVPVLFFTPEFKKATKIIQLALYNYDRASAKSRDVIFQDNEAMADTLRCAGGKTVTIINPNGSVRLGHSSNEIVDSFWHYIVRVPIACVGLGAERGQVGEHYLKGEVKWARPTPPNTPQIIHTTSQVLRVVIARKGFPKFSPTDQYYDIHVHTIAEQTTWDTTKVDAARKAFGGPLAMLMESAYALGLTDVQLRNGNWSAFRDRVATTDHNVFFSTGVFDSGQPPKFGPTSSTNGHDGEFQWYRQQLGELGGEEITLQGTGRVNTSMPSARLGSHFLSYGSPHFEGPWHGGEFQAHVDAIGVDIPGAGVTNPLNIDAVMHEMSTTNGFGYAAHPFSNGIGWSQDTFERAIGLGLYNDGGPGSPILQADSGDFVFKGTQVWNEKRDMVSAANLSGDGLKISALTNFDPFTPRNSGQVFQANLDWDRALEQTFQEYWTLVVRGLTYSFKQQPGHRFIRKLYLSGGTDAHGDFNYALGAEATAVAEAWTAVGVDPKMVDASNNAFGRVRTYTLTSERDIEPGSVVRATFTPGTADTELVEGAKPAAPAAPTSSAKSVLAYREGNTVITDGPICTFSADANCRFNSDRDSLTWHDQTCAWQNYDGLIGGRGRFDGGGTMLVPHRNADVWIRTKWDGRNDYFSEDNGTPEQMRFIVYGGGTGAIPSGPRGKVTSSSLQGVVPESPWKPSAMILKGTLGAESSRAICLTNPIYTVPYAISVRKPETCPIKPGALKITVSFGVSMDATLRNEQCENANCVATGNETNATTYRGMQIILKPINNKGESGKTAFKLTAERTWFAHNLPGSGFEKIQDASFYAANEKEIPCATEGWNSEVHQPQQGVSSFAVVISDIRDMHLNPLHAIADTFTINNAN